MIRKHPFYNIGKKHPAYVNGSGKGYNYKHVLRSIELLGITCSTCNSSHDIYTHHKDHNSFNNPLDGSNWKRLCRSCHAKLHWKPKRKYKTEKDYQIAQVQRKRDKKRALIISAFSAKFGSKEFLRTSDLCKLLKVCKERIRQKRNEGCFRYVKIGGNYYYPKDFKLCKSTKNKSAK